MRRECWKMAWGYCCVFIRATLPFPAIPSHKHTHTRIHTFANRNEIERWYVFDNKVHKKHLAAIKHPRICIRWSIQSSLDYVRLKFLHLFTVCILNFTNMQLSCSSTKKKMNRDWLYSFNSNALGLGSEWLVVFFLFCSPPTPCPPYELHKVFYVHLQKFERMHPNIYLSQWLLLNEHETRRQGKESTNITNKHRQTHIQTNESERMKTNERTE